MKSGIANERWKGWEMINPVLFPVEENSNNTLHWNHNFPASTPPQRKFHSLPRHELIHKFFISCHCLSRKVKALKRQERKIPEKHRKRRHRLIWQLIDSC